VYLTRADKARTICRNFGMVFVPDSPVFALSQDPPFLVQTSNFPVTSDLRRIEYLNVPISAHAQGTDITDTANWVPLRGGFVANGNERFVALGNFDPLWLLDTTRLPGWQTYFYSGAGVYADDVSVYALKALAHSDSAVCASGLVQARAYGGYDHYLWSTGDTTAQVTLPGPGTYWVEVSNWCGTQRDSITLRAYDTLALEQAIPSQLSLCQDQFPYRLYAPMADVDSVVWSTGVRGAEALVYAPGSYSLTAYTPCGPQTRAFSVSLSPSPTPNLGADTTLCLGTVLLLQGNAANARLWSTGSTNQSLSVSSAARIWLMETTPAGCSASDTVQVWVEQRQVDFLPADTAQANALSLTLSLPTTLSNIQWSTGSTGVYTTVYTSGQVTYTATDEQGCQVGETVNVRLSLQEWMPSLLHQSHALDLSHLLRMQGGEVYNAMGQVVARLKPGLNAWPNPSTAPGLYTYRLQLGNQERFGKMVVVE
jgi:hypothetical protein